MATLRLWWWNPTRGRHELWTRDPADPRGVGRVAAVQALPGTDLSDLPAGVEVVAYAPEFVPFVQAAAQGDATALAAVRAYSDSRNGAAPQASQDQQQVTAAYRALRDSPEQIEAAVYQIAAILGVEEGARALAQADYALRQRMAAAGYGPQQQADFYAQAPGVAPPTATYRAGSSANEWTIRMPPAYLRAYTNVAATAATGTLQQQAHQLQQATNVFQRHQTGAERLQEYGDARRAYERAAAQYALDEQQMAADPGNDRRLRPTTSGQWTYDPSGHTALENERQRLDRMQQAYWPEQYAAEQHRRRDDARGGWLPENVRRQLYPGTPTEPPAYAQGGRVTGREDVGGQVARARAYLQRYARGGTVGRREKPA